eukprot:Seg1553.4 transcript_id=Seg1553.4/GoldUCD/mRNA.D3Y31 product="hypothetical protein" protein_id=Seg1553.4/GoldUCD/D3Y31
MISTMKVEELKNFLRLRGLKVGGRKQELVSRVFVAIENEVPIVQTAEEVEMEIAKDYEEKMQDPFKIVDGWLPEDEGKDGKIMKAHCSCMAGVSQTCNHVAAALFRIEAAVRMGLTNPSCTSTSCGWLPNNKAVKPVKIKDLKLSRGDFGRRGKKQAELNCSPKKHFDPTKGIDAKLNLDEVVAALSLVCDKSESMIFAAVPKEQTEETAVEELDQEIHSLDSFYKISESPEEFLLHMEYFPSHVAEIEAKTRGQSENPLWFSVRKHMITASKAHDVKARMEIFKKASGKGIDFSSTFSKISGENGVNPDLPALQYGRAMENEAVTSFERMFEETHRNAKLEDCGIYLCQDMPFQGGSPDRIVSCDCCGKFCLEVKCPFSISHKSPLDPDAKLPYLKRSSDQTLSMNRNHRLFFTFLDYSYKKERDL